MKKKASKKNALLARVTNNLGDFYPKCRGSFMCPTCLSVIPLTEARRISVAHIVPAAAGGGSTTFLCTDCNSNFGRDQDKWLGEYICTKRDRPALIQGSHFFLDQTRVRGTVSRGTAGNLDVFINRKLNSPQTISAVINQLSGPPRARSRLRIPIPVMEHRDSIGVGFLTAAYLLWFKGLGYSWVLQTHLDLVREQIRRPRERIISGYRWIAPGHPIAQPWAGVADVAGKLALVVCLFDSVVLLPPADETTFYPVNAAESELLIDPAPHGFLGHLIGGRMPPGGPDAEEEIRISCGLSGASP